MKDIPGFEGRYAVTEDGRVWSYPKKATWKKHQNGHFLTERNSGFHMRFNRRVKRRYKRVCLRKDGKNKDFYLHRLVADAFIPNPLCLPEVNHLDGNESNNKVENLEWCDRKGNSVHMIKLGNSTRGIKNPMAKITETDVKLIREMVLSGVPRSIIAQTYNITKSNVSHIHRRVNWAWLV
jgi:hypothetical protein